MINEKAASVLYSPDDVFANAGRYGGAAQAGTDGAKIAHILRVDVIRSMQDDVPLRSHVIVARVYAADAKGKTIASPVGLIGKIKTQAALK